MVSAEDDGTLRARVLCDPYFFILTHPVEVLPYDLESFSPAC